MGRQVHSSARSQYLDPVLSGNHHVASHHPRASSMLSTLALRPLITPLQLPPRAESTRIQLQKQLLREQQSNLLSVPINAHILPGLKTSAAFFDSLRTNLYLHAAPPSPSPISTPPSMRGSTASLPPPSPLSTPIDFPMESVPDSIPPRDLLDGIPELTTSLVNGDDNNNDDNGAKVAALKLIADSIAQMRQTANRALILHPVNLAVTVAVLASVARYMRTAEYDWSIIITTLTGILMILLVTFRALTEGYITSAEKVNWDWLGDADVVVTKFGEDVIGAVVVEWLSGESRTKKKKAWQGEIRAWTVKMKYRGKGVGTALLEEVVREARKKGAESLEFAVDHANSERFLPSMYNATFDRREQTSRDLLLDLYQSSSPARQQRKYSK